MSKDEEQKLSNGYRGEPVCSPCPETASTDGSLIIPIWGAGKHLLYTKKKAPDKSGAFSISKEVLQLPFDLVFNAHCNFIENCHQQKSYGPNTQGDADFVGGGVILHNLL